MPLTIGRESLFKIQIAQSMTNAKVMYGCYRFCTARTRNQGFGPNQKAKVAE
jgi:hypothetical protein